MNARILASIDGMPRDEWLALRDQGIGSSDIAAILSLDRFRSPYAVWAQKSGEIDQQAETHMMRMGQKLEGVVAEMYAEEHPGILLVKPTAMYQHREHDFMLASPDRLLIHGQDWETSDGTVVHDFQHQEPEHATGLLEIKTGRNLDVWEDGPPLGVQLQVMWQLEVMDLDHGVIASLHYGHEYQEWTIERDPALVEMLIAAGAEFWQRIQDRNPPPVDGYESTTEALNEIHKKAELEAGVDVSDMLERFTERQALMRQKKSVEYEIDTIDNELRERLGEAAVGSIDGVSVVTWKPVKGRVDMKAYLAAHPEREAEVEEFRQEESRRLNFSRSRAAIETIQGEQ